MSATPTTNPTADILHAVGNQCPWSVPHPLPENEATHTAARQRHARRLIPSEGAITP
jgi:hypothetical protein